MKFFIAALISLASFSVQASTVAVIDSGTDYLHKDLNASMWQNMAEAPHGENLRDEDGNGYEDDIWGWNFAEGNSYVIADEYRGMLTDDIRKFFLIQERMMKGTATSEEVDWLRAKVRDESYIKQLSIYGNFMHGTHVGGIAIKGNPDAKMLAVKLIPTEVKLPADEKSLIATVMEKETGDDSVVDAAGDGGIVEKMIKKFIEQMAVQQMTLMTEIATYVGNHGADIANGSFGTGYRQIEAVFAGIIEKFLRRKPSKEEIRNYTLHYFENVLKEGQKMVAAAPNTLFVFAAGNDGSNNDEFPTTPTNIRADNVISVAATMGYSQLASFSNYGTKHVDIAAPGVGINSTAPDDEYLSVSGTSQAAPYVANVASVIKDSNPALKPVEIKKILMGTVDVKGWLKTKVTSSGLVNKSRAVKAAELTKSLSIEEAIKESIQLVPDQNVSKIMLGNKGVMDLDTYVLPLPSTISFGK